MSITMTWADGFLALLLGIIGSIVAAYLYSKAPNLSNFAAQWFARRSRQARAARLLKLQRQLAQIETFKNNAGRYVGWLVRDLSHADMRTTVSLVFFMIGFSSLTVSQIKSELYPLSFVSYFALGSGLGVFFLAGKRRDRIFWTIAILKC